MLGGMNVAGIPYRTIWPAPAGSAVSIVDQTLLPHRFAAIRLSALPAFVHAIRDMLVRGAPLIGDTAAYGGVANKISTHLEALVMYIRSLDTLARTTGVRLAPTSTHAPTPPSTPPRAA